MKNWRSRKIVILAFWYIGLCFVASDSLALDNSSLSGVFNMVIQESSFSDNGGRITAAVIGNNVMLDFDGAGSCSLSFTEKSYEVDFPDQDEIPMMTSMPESGDETCTYTVAEDGSVELFFSDTSTETLWLSADGNMLLAGGIQDNYSSTQFVAIKEGTDLSAASLKGTYKLFTQSSGFYVGSGWISAENYAANNTVTFDGIGKCSINESGTTYSTPITNPDVNEFTDHRGQINKFPDSGKISCTYTVAPNGAATLTTPDGDTESFWVSADGNKILLGGTDEWSDDNGTVYQSHQGVGVKLGSGMNNASLQGAFTLVSQKFILGEETTPPVLVSGSPAQYYPNQYTNAIYSNIASVEFDGLGTCTITTSGADLEVLYYHPYYVSVWPDTERLTCSYKVAANGITTVNCGDGSETFTLSGDGQTLISGSTYLEPKSTEDPRTSYHAEQVIAIKTLATLGQLDAPAYISVPDVDTKKGSYTVSWGASDTTGVTYILEESTEPDFPETTATRVAYRGTNSAVTITRRSQGVSYYYRVSATKIAMAPSDWATAANPCNVGAPVRPKKLFVPKFDADGSFTISWYASPTPGVTYVLEESTDSYFTLDVRTVGSTTELSLDPLADASALGTVYYRVRATKADFPDSAAITSKGCNLGAPSAPATLTVPPSDADGAYVVSWDPSTTAGATYILQEATSADFTTGLRTAGKGQATLKKITKRKVGQTYYYRVLATLKKWAPSDWTDGDEGCLIDAR